ncbi:hypothetical protein [Alienimonas chondri]|uniref:hypothetical protein n=1 Tax=Alienimonas chondri TaxID=2681879 RepID=UPI0014885E4B|nr:hypothetical protein [Alienimonas chondri]
MSAQPNANPTAAAAPRPIAGWLATQPAATSFNPGSAKRMPGEGDRNPDNGTPVETPDDAAAAGRCGNRRPDGVLPDGVLPDVRF